MPKLHWIYDEAVAANMKLSFRLFFFSRTLVVNFINERLCSGDTHRHVCMYVALCEDAPKVEVNSKEVALNYLQ